MTRWGMEIQPHGGWGHGNVASKEGFLQWHSASRRGADRRLGARRAGLLRGLALLAGGTITAGAGSGTSLARPGDGRRLPLHLLVEDVLGLRFGQGVPVGYGFDEGAGDAATVASLTER
jgi:hypothetical protein